MMWVLDHAATGVLVAGLLAAFCGFACAAVLNGRMILGSAIYWQSLLKPLRQRMEDQHELMQQALDAENTTRTGRIADWFLRRGTVLVIIGGVAKAVLFFIEKQTA